jgi:RNA polymerase sigma-70 factor, ECF subfamily
VGDADDSTDGGRRTPAQAEFAAWIGPHLGVLKAVATREVGAPDSEDVVQETLIRAWRKRSTYDRNRGSARAWLVAILLDRARRHRIRHPHRAVSLPDEERGEPTADRVDIEAAIRSLPTRQQQIVALHYLADLPMSDVAGVLGISVGAVKSQLFAARAARAALRTVLERS